MELMENFVQQAKQNPNRIVFPEANDERILQAVNQIQEQGIAKPILIGKQEEINAQATELNLNLQDVTVVFPETSSDWDQYIQAYCKKRSNVSDRVAAKLLKKPLLFGAMMVAQGDADGMVAGVAHTTSSVIQAAGLTIGFEDGISNPSSFFVMIIPEFDGKKDHILIFADCAVAIKPDSGQLAEIAVTTGRNAQRLLDLEPKIGLLSFSSKGSAHHEDTEKVTQALEIARKLAPELDIDGEFQADAAIVPKVAQKKIKDSSIAGNCNVLIFPDLNSGNIAYKLVQYLAKASAVGPFLQGFAKPVNDLSRGASVEDIIGVTAVTVVQAKK